MTDSTTSNSTAPPQLDYGRRQRMACISRHRKKLILLALFIATAVPIWRNWASLKHRVLWIYWSHRAAAHAMPSSPIELSTDVPNEVKQRLTDGDFTLSVIPTADYYPNIYRELVRYDSRLSLATSPNVGPVAFMGMRHRPDGAQRLVVICDGGGPTHLPLCFTGVVVLPPPEWFDPLPPASLTPVQMMVYGGNEPWVHLMSGIADPADASHIIFTFNLTPMLHNPGKPRRILATGQIDAYLQNDDSITFIPQAGPAASSIWPAQNVMGNPDALRKGPPPQSRVKPAATTLPAVR